MNWIDFAIVIVFLLFAMEGFGKSLFSEIYDLLSFLAAFFLSLRFYDLISRYLENTYSFPHSFSNALGFIIAWFLIETTLFIIARIFFRKIKLGLIPGEKFLSCIPSFLRGIIFVSILLVLLAVFPLQPKIKKDVNNSKIGSFILAQTYQIEAPLKNVFGGLSNDTLTFLTIEPKTSESVNLGFKTDKFYFDDTLETSMIDLVNKERVSRGLKPLVFDIKLREVGREHSADMFKRGYFSHYSPRGQDVSFRAEKAQVSYMVLGENLAFAPTLSLAHTGLMNSPGHRANILSEDYHKIGIGIAQGSEYGIMITQVFTN